ncbi:ankyrin repeat domain-containing protein [Rudaea sp.]|uniref:ankyrin repeat domain-containing protein n=1 Tax=Rudaea sp. TaxID=2136325 RepID=UPI00321F91B5
MRSVIDVLKEVSSVADFCGIDATDANTKGLFNNYPLHVAAVWGDCEAISLLASAGARVNQKGEHGFTPLMEAVGQGHFEAVKQLIELGAEPLPNDHGDTPSQYARISGNEPLANYLAKNGF